MKTIAVLLALAAVGLGLIGGVLFLIAVGAEQIAFVTLGQQRGAPGKIGSAIAAVVCVLAGYFTARIAHKESKANREHEQWNRSRSGF